MHRIEEILNLKKEGLSYKEIAKELNMPIGTVKSYFSRCKVRLKEHVEELDSNIIEMQIVSNVRKCLCCGKELVGSRNKKFCSDCCRLRHWRATKYEQRAK